MSIHQHRHVFPGYEGPDNKWWHDPKLVHRRYPTAHDGVIEERDHTPIPRGPRKPEVPQYSYNEYGEQVIPAVKTEGEAFMEAVMAIEAAEEVVKAPTKAGK